MFWARRSRGVNGSAAKYTGKIEGLERITREPATGLVGQETDGRAAWSAER